MNTLQKKPRKALGWPLIALTAFTLLSGIGYASFGRHPELLQYAPSLASFFSISFTFFAQGHILLTAFVLIYFLSINVRMKWVGGFVAVYAISLGSELTGTATGLPFGPYSYTDLLGPKWLDLVPVLIPLSWFTMTIPAYSLSNIAFSGKSQFMPRIAFGALLLTLWDLALDPAMSFLTPYWQWGETGAYYGMPWINLFGWFATGIVLMSALELLKTREWIGQLDTTWVKRYYLLVLLLPILMVLAAGLWGCIALTAVTVGLSFLYINKNGGDTSAGDEIIKDSSSAPDALETEHLNAYFTHHSRSFSFAARFFSPEQYRLVTRLYAFCRTTDDIADNYAISHGKEEAGKQLDEWERRVKLSYQGMPSGITWLDELMHRSSQSGMPFDIVRDLIAGCRSDLDQVELQTMEELDRYTYQVASVVGIWLCYLFGVRDPKVLKRAEALGKAMQITNIVRDVGEDLRMHRLYLPAELLKKHQVHKDELLAMEAGTLQPTEAYKIMIEDLMESAESDYHFAFRGLSAVPPSFARAAAVASQIYKGIHRSVRRNRYNNFQLRAYTRWYEKAYLSITALNHLKKIQKRPFLPAKQSLYVKDKNVHNNGHRHVPLLTLMTVALLNGPAPTLVPNTDPIEQNSITHVVSDMNGPESMVPQSMALKNKALQQIRSWYIEAVEDEAVIEKALHAIDDLDNPSAVIQAYEAAFVVLKAKHVFWPARKMKHLRQGLPVLDSLLAASPTDVEIRYLRLLSCYYLPRFLGRGHTVSEDIRALGHLLPSARANFPTTLYYDMVQFVARDKRLPQEEKLALAKVLESKPPTIASYSGKSTP